MPTIRLASFNIEWMNDWFTKDSEPVAFRPTFRREDHTSNTDETARRAADTIREIDPDILAIQEGPSRPAELELFIQQYLSNNGVPIYKFILSDSGNEQRPAILYKPNAVNSLRVAPSADITSLTDGWLADVNGHEFLETYKFTRLPLVINIQIEDDSLQLIVLHTKSSFVNKGRELWENCATRQNYVHEALRNRRRNSTEAMRVRQYVDTILKDNRKAKIIILGDLNDGPGMDYFENYLAHNTIDVLVGSAFEPELIFYHAQHDVNPQDRYTAIFDDFVTGEKNKHLFLDHILLSPSLTATSGLRRVPDSGTIHHVEYNHHTVNNGTFRENRPSDHRPVSVLLEY
ncbi:endonuclease [Brevibacillus sp. SKDU10]|uniref:endonuclease/exonuclease/phosphatase family protein n=1 Tax=Brevibacillus sp. SKDU10 TaxID=1247872 RepID=UPI0007C97978|nr:endonuclease/exonuclease/phosphatase family protein [Brevibacillus sp. SKDU10]OAJ76149.1 endonuclease [Brevibacillus sp. SKDU10]